MNEQSNPLAGLVAAFDAERERIEAEHDQFIECDNETLLAQIGRMNVLAISGGRVSYRPTGVTLPVRYGYRVTVDLEAGDTYCVRRVHMRNGVANVKGEMCGVYCEQVGDVAYRASCYLDEF